MTILRVDFIGDKMKKMSSKTARGTLRRLALLCALPVLVLASAAQGSSAGAGMKVAQAPAPVQAPVVLPAPPAPPALSPHISKRLPELKAFSTRMQVPYDQLIDGMQGLELIYERRYSEARSTFRGLEQRFPESAIGPFGLVMLAQAQMGENLDFLHDAVYTASYKESITRMDRAIGKGVAVPWNTFLRGCAKGVNSLYMYRKDKLLAALQEGLSALSDVEAAQKADAAFMDPYIGLGVYNYWRSSITLRYKNLPFFPDKRDQGLRQMEIARDKGIITPTLARLALGYSYLDRRLPEKALRETNLLKASYPQSVLTLQLAGQVYTRLHMASKAKDAYLDVLKIDPKNVAVCNSLGMFEMNRTYDYAKASQYFERYVNNIPNDYYLPQARTRLGDTYWLTGQKAKAEEQWKLALAAKSDYKTAKARLAGKYPIPMKPRVARTVNAAPKPPGAPLQKPTTAIQARDAAMMRAGIALPADVPASPAR